MAKKGLGKGIDVLIPQAKEKTKSEKENIRTKEVIKEVVKEVIKEVMIYGTIIPYIITFVFGRIIIIFSYVDIILVKNAQNLKGV